MKGRIYLHGILAAILLLVTACDEDERRGGVVGVAQPASDRMIVNIQGPNAVRLPGEYRWEAVVDGADGNVEYEWELYEIGEGDLVQNTAGPVFDMFLEASQPIAYELRLRVSSEDDVALATTIVTICPFTQEPMDECSAQLVFADNGA